MTAIRELLRPAGGKSADVCYGYSDGWCTMWLKRPDGDFDQLPGAYGSVDELIEAMEDYARRHGLTIDTREQIRAEHRDVLAFADRSDDEACYPCA
ncbi:hypothetical protein [Sphingobium phenoxybenzoativorans]|uniref:hypothetical protein n=1 Tax=Sphingobium phenoxybenzoativorans TaxID=1592790 RepID=UPI0008733C03|nr:hypothetical protein [Sphingobium phenoxybenzoativorans]